MVVGASVFGYVIANVSALVTSMSSFGTKALERTYLIKEFLKHSKVHSTLSQNVINHFHQASRMSSNLDKIELLERLPTRLRNEILLIGYREAISAIPFFKFITNVSIKLHILHLMTPQVAVTGRRIINEGKAGNQMVFLVEGSASILKILDPDSRGVKRLSLSKRSSERSRSTARMTVALQILKALKEKEMQVKEREKEKEIKEKEIEKMEKEKEMVKHIMTEEKLREREHVVIQRDGAIEDYRNSEEKNEMEMKEKVSEKLKKEVGGEAKRALREEGEGLRREVSLGHHTTAPLCREHPLSPSPQSLPHSPTISAHLSRSLSLDTALCLSDIAEREGGRHGSPRMPHPMRSRSTQGTTPQRGSMRMSIIEERESGDEGEGGDGKGGDAVDGWDVGESGAQDALGANAYSAPSPHRAQSLGTLASSSNTSPAPAPQLSASSSSSSYFTSPSSPSFSPPTRPLMNTPPPPRPEDGAERSVPVSGIRVTVLGRLDVGDFRGHREIMRGEQYAYTVIASEPCKYYTLNKQDIVSLIAQSPDIALELQAALGHAVFDEEQHTAEKRARRRKLQFISEVKEKFLASRMKVKKKDFTMNGVVMRMMRNSRKQSTSIAPMASRSGSRRGSTGIPLVDGPDRSGKLTETGNVDVRGTIVGGTAEGMEEGNDRGRDKGMSGTAEVSSMGAYPSLRSERSFHLPGAGELDYQKDTRHAGIGHSALGAIGPLGSPHSTLESSARGSARSSIAVAEDDETKNNQKAIDEKAEGNRKGSRRGSAAPFNSEVNEKVDSFQGEKKEKAIDKRKKEKAAVKKIEKLEKIFGTDPVLPTGTLRASSLILFKRQQTALFLRMGAVVSSPALKGAGVGAGGGAAVRKARKNSTEATESHLSSGPKSLVRSHRSYNDLSFAPLHTIARELFLGPGPTDSEISAAKQQRYQRRASYPSDQSQFDLYDSRCTLDDLVLHRGNH